ncbi:asparagine synthetase B family protein [Streptomyces sp. NPDC059193]|uniref:asparagine synthetase B family protein n=1 Tax=Streptomyces sp. NPDC059193 TaxID=3346763 RepID=UPI00368040DE
MTAHPDRARGPRTCRTRPGAGCRAALGRTAVGEVTLHNRPVLLAALAGEARAAAAPPPPPPPPDCSDGELLLHCWALLGPAGVALAEGMFVLAVLDGPDLVLIRDHVGARTLFYARAGGAWAASTSLRTLRRWPALGTSMNLSAVRSFLTFAYLPGEETLLTGVREVLPGRVLRLTRDGGVTETVHWEPREHVEDPGPAGPTGHVLTLRALLEQATAARLPVAEPAAVLLSGGIDSSLVTALAAKLHSHPVHTYSIGFGDDLPNELGYSGLVASRCHTRHRVLNVSGAAVAARLAKAAALLDSPVGDPLTVPNLMPAEAVAADGATVVLNGEGGDPVFGGPKNLPMLVQEMHRTPGAPWDEDRATAYLRSYRKCWTDLPVLLTAPALDALRDAPRLERHVEPYLLARAAGGGPYAMAHLLNQLLLGRRSRQRGLFRPETVRTWLKGEGTLLPRQGGKLWLVHRPGRVRPRGALRGTPP